MSKNVQLQSPPANPSVNQLVSLSPPAQRAPRAQRPQRRPMDNFRLILPKPEARQLKEFISCQKMKWAVKTVTKGWHGLLKYDEYNAIMKQSTKKGGGMLGCGTQQWIPKCITFGLPDTLGTKRERRKSKEQTESRLIFRLRFPRSLYMQFKYYAMKLIGKYSNSWNNQRRWE